MVVAMVTVYTAPVGSYSANGFGLHDNDRQCAGVGGGLLERDL